MKVRGTHRLWTFVIPALIVASIGDETPAEVSIGPTLSAGALYAGGPGAFADITLEALSPDENCFPDLYVAWSSGHQKIGPSREVASTFPIYLGVRGYPFRRSIKPLSLNPYWLLGPGMCFVNARVNDESILATPWGGAGGLGLEAAIFPRIGAIVEGRGFLALNSSIFTIMGFGLSYYF
ncbi:MAG: hypothetical protein ACUVXI_12940 [bacterium]